MKNKQYYIYLTINKINGKKYIGKHYGYLDDNYIGSGKNLLSAVKKYGKENFEKEVLLISQNEEDNCQNEKMIIKLFNAVDSKEFYNIAEGGEGGNLIAGFSKEEKDNYRKKLSYYCKNIRDNSVYRTEGFRKAISAVTSGSNNGMYQKHHTEESKQKMSMTKKGMYVGEKNPMYGKKHTEESKKKISEKKQGKYSGENNPMFGKTGENAINGKRIDAYDKDWNYVCSFVSRTAAANFLGLKSSSRLSLAVKNQTFYNGYYWKNSDDQNRSVETNTEG